ncbi:MAG: MFS transporter [Paludibacteraceae bacterium]|nr:MFS transporter [Paludibacteraceae bacterium]
MGKSNKIAINIVLCLAATHLINDLLQAILTASYPVLKDELSLSFTEIGLVTLVYQIAASVFQPIVGLFFDRNPKSHSLWIATTLTSIGLVGLALAPSIYYILPSVFIIGVGSATLHPEASRIASLASGGRRGLAQSTFQVGGNIGSSVGPLLVALIVAPNGRKAILWFLLFSVLAYVVAQPISRWFGDYLTQAKKEKKSMAVIQERPLSTNMTLVTLTILMILIFSKYIYMASLTSYYTFYLIEQFGVSIQTSQICLFIFLAATAMGTFVGGPVGDRIGRKYVIWISILGTAPFSLFMPHVGLIPTIILSFCAGFILSSAFPAILLYAQELLPYRLGLVSGMFYGFAFGIAGISSAVLGHFIDIYGLKAIYDFCAFMPLLGLVAAFLPKLK